MRCRGNGGDRFLHEGTVNRGQCLQNGLAAFALATSSALLTSGLLWLRAPGVIFVQLQLHISSQIVGIPIGRHIHWPEHCSRQHFFEASLGSEHARAHVEKDHPVEHMQIPPVFLHDSLLTMSTQDSNQQKFEQDFAF